jgi:diguanylate cyclase (GGDEF)-like protein
LTLIAAHYPRISKQLSRTIVGLFLLTQLFILTAAGFALRNDWVVRTEATQADLFKTANIGNLLVENALLNADKTLHSAQANIEALWRMGPTTDALVHQALADAMQAFERYNPAGDLGLLLFANAQGVVTARNDAPSTHAIDVSDRFYFKDLRDHPAKRSTVGPILQARTTGLWVFHMAVPLRTPQGSFAGIVVQQLSATDIGAMLATYTDTRSFEALATQSPGGAISFVYPLPSDSNDTNDARDAPTRLSKDNGASWVKQANANVRLASGPNTNSTITTTRPDPAQAPSLVGYARSPLLGLTTVVSTPVVTLQIAFLKNNFYLLAYVLIGLLCVAAIFWYLYRITQQLAAANSSSLHDALTTLHNRRALDLQLPISLRSAMREQTPLGVLFIDIDHFRDFNERYGHESGDVALQAVAGALASVCQRPLDFICRWGGEEFVAVLPNTDARAIHKLARDMLRAVRLVQLHMGPNGASINVPNTSCAVTPMFTSNHTVNNAAEAGMESGMGTDIGTDIGTDTEVDHNGNEGTKRISDQDNAVQSGRMPRLTVSIGFLSTRVTQASLDDDLVGAADSAMLQAKQRGRDQCVMAASNIQTTCERMTCHTHIL